MVELQSSLVFQLCNLPYWVATLNEHVGGTGG